MSPGCHRNRLMQSGCRVFFNADQWRQGRPWQIWRRVCKGGRALPFWFRLVVCYKDCWQGYVYFEFSVLLELQTCPELYFYIVHCSCFVLVEIDWEFEESSQSCTWNVEGYDFSQAAKSWFRPGLVRMPATYFKCFQVETRDFNSQPLNLYFWREDQNFHRFHQLHTGVTRDTMILGSV